jgi:hypothetical protein
VPISVSDVDTLQAFHCWKEDLREIIRRRISRIKAERKEKQAGDETWG